MNKFWDSVNRGVSLSPASTTPHTTRPLTNATLQRQWKDIRSKYVEGGDDDDE